MWPGPYGNHGSRKYLFASLDQSLKRMHLDYVDIFYHHCPDPDTPIEETMQALHDIVKSGKALYVGISNYNEEQTAVAIRTLKEMGTHLLIHQPNYSMMNRSIENGLTDLLSREGVGCIAFGPLAGGILAGRYQNGFDADSRAVNDPRYLRPESVTDKKLEIVRQLNTLAQSRGQTLPQMVLAWTLRSESVTSALIGASKPEQILENIKTFDNMEFSIEELTKIDEILST